MMTKIHLTNEPIRVILSVQDWLYLLAYIELNGSNENLPNRIVDAIYDALNA